MPRTTPTPQTSAYPCPVCHAPTRAGVISRTLRLIGLPPFLADRMRFAKLWTCPTCATRGGEIPFTYLTFGGMNFRNLIVATYHQGVWSLTQHTSRDTINAITRIENNIQPVPTEGVAEEWNPPAPATPVPPTPAPVETPSQIQDFTPSAVGLTFTPIIRVRVDARFFARDAQGRVYEWIHVMQPVELGHWEQIGSTASEDTAGVTNFCTRYIRDSANTLRCDCGVELPRNTPLNLYRRGFTTQQVQEIDAGTAGYYHCNDTSHHTDGARRGYIKFTDGTVLEFYDEAWVPRRAMITRCPEVCPQCAVQCGGVAAHLGAHQCRQHGNYVHQDGRYVLPAREEINPQEVLELLLRKLERDHTDGVDTELMATELVTLFDPVHDPARVATVGSYKHLDLAVAILRKAGFTSQADLVAQYEGPDDEHDDGRDGAPIG